MEDCSLSSVISPLPNNLICMDNKTHFLRPSRYPEERSFPYNIIYTAVLLNIFILIAQKVFIHFLYFLEQRLRHELYLHLRIFMRI